MWSENEERGVERKVDLESGEDKWTEKVEKEIVVRVERESIVKMWQKAKLESIVRKGKSEEIK